VRRTLQVGNHWIRVKSKKKRKLDRLVCISEGCGVSCLYVLTDACLCLWHWLIVQSRSAVPINQILALFATAGFAAHIFLSKMWCCMSTLYFFDQVPVDILAKQSLHKQDLRSYCYRLMINTLFCHCLKNAYSFKETECPAGNEEHFALLTSYQLKSCSAYL